MFRSRLALSIVAIAALCRSANADVSYAYVWTQDTNGPLVTVNFFLQETLTNGSQSFINTIGGGLTAAGFAVDVVSTTGGTAAQLVSNSFVTPTTFGGPAVVAYNQGGNDLEVLQTIGTAQPKLTTDADGKIFLGSVQFAVGTGQTTYQLSSLFNSTVLGGNGQLGGANGNTTTFLPSPLGSDLDTTTAAYVGANGIVNTIVIGPSVAVPEPTSLIFGGLAVAGVIPAVRRRKTIRDDSRQATATA
jgi:hypothetical protein